MSDELLVVGVVITFVSLLAAQIIFERIRRKRLRNKWMLVELIRAVHEKNTSYASFDPNIMPEAFINLKPSYLFPFGACAWVTYERVVVTSRNDDTVYFDSSKDADPELGELVREICQTAHPIKKKEGEK
jgi:hypothetical protein